MDGFERQWLSRLVRADSGRRSPQSAAPSQSARCGSPGLGLTRERSAKTLLHCIRKIAISWFSGRNLHTEQEILHHAGKIVDDQPDAVDQHLTGDHSQEEIPAAEIEAGAAVLEDHYLDEPGDEYIEDGLI